MASVSALRDRTWAENRVFDSDNTPLIDALSAETKPYITVFTDMDNRIEMEGMDSYSTQRNLSLVMEMGLASAVVVDNGVKTINIPQTDQAMEALIDMLEHQAIGALVGDPYSKWGEIVKSIVTRIYRIPSRRGGSSAKGTRWAARQVTLVCQTMGDPVPGQVLTAAHPITKFLALARLSGQAGMNMAEAANLIEMALNTTTVPDWRLAQAWLGLTERGVRSLGIAPMPETDQEPPIPFDNEDSDVDYDDSIDLTAPETVVT